MNFISTVRISNLSLEKIKLLDENVMQADLIYRKTVQLFAYYD